MRDGLVDVDDHRDGAGRQHRGGRRHVGVGGNQDLVAGPEADARSWPRPARCCRSPRARNASRRDRRRSAARSGRTRRRRRSGTARWSRITLAMASISSWPTTYMRRLPRFQSGLIENVGGDWFANKNQYRSCSMEPIRQGRGRFELTRMSAFRARMAFNASRSFSRAKPRSSPCSGGSTMEVHRDRLEVERRDEAPPQPLPDRLKGGNEPAEDLHAGIVLGHRQPAGRDACRRARRSASGGEHRARRMRLRCVAK